MYESVMNPMANNLESDSDNTNSTTNSNSLIRDFIGLKSLEDETESEICNPRNVLVIAYGQTGTGKTHSMFGTDRSLENISEGGMG